jgi:radical SAM superfamily enzyme YgiQ (UPF0313 family)
VARIALIKPPATYADWFARPVLGLSTISAVLSESGFENQIFDALFWGWSEEELVRRVAAYDPDLIGVTAMTHEITRAARIVASLKARLGDRPTVVGGPHITALPERTLAEFPVFDYGVYGEGERTTVELVKCLFGGKPAPDLRAIEGIVFRNGDQIVVNEPRPFLTAQELDELPYPAFDQYYGDDRNALTGSESYYVMYTARGCPYRCSFCMQVLGRKVRGMSPERIVGEIEYAISRYGAHTVDFADEIFLFDSPRTRKTLQMMIDRGLSNRIRWSGLTRANMVSRELIALAKRAGCFDLEMGVESGDDEILRRIHKQITVEQVREAVQIIKDHDITLGACFILGHPHETHETARKTIDLAVELNTDTIAVGLMVPYPGTEIYEMAKQGRGGYRLLSEDWSKYDKYGGKSLELEAVSYEELVRYQRRAYIQLYLKNFRVFDMVDYIWRRRRSLWYFLARKVRATLDRGPKEEHVSGRLAR